MLINSFVGIGYILDHQFKFGMILVLYWGVFGVLALVNSLKWIKQ